MTKYDLFSYLKTLYEVEMAQIDLEVVEPRCEFFSLFMTNYDVILVYKSRNVDAPDDRATENYNYERLFKGNSPNFYDSDRVKGT